MEEELYSSLLSKKKLEELLDRAGIVDAVAREAEWQRLKEYFLFEVMKLTVARLPEEDKKKLEEGLNPEVEEDRKKYYRKIDELIRAKKLAEEVMKEIFKEAVVGAYSDYVNKIKQP